MLAVLLIAVAAAWALRRGRGMRIATPEEASDAAEASLAGFHTVGAVLGSDGAAALVVDAGDRVAVCRRHGARVSVREIGWTAIRATGEGLLIDTGDRRFGAVVVADVNALDVRRLRPQDDRSRASSSAM